MLTIRPSRSTSAALALAVLLGAVVLGAVMGPMAAGAPTGESGLTNRPWTAEQMVLPAKPLLERVLAERRDDRSPSAPTLGTLLSPAAAVAMRRSVVARHRRGLPAAAGRLGCVGPRCSTLPPARLSRGGAWPG